MRTAKEAEIRGSAFTSLLDRKVREAEAQMKAELETSLWGRTQQSTPLRQAISDAYDQTMFNLTLNGTLDKYRKNITENIFKENSILKVLREEAMTITNVNDPTGEAVNKRRVKQASKRVRKLGKYLDAFNWENGDTVRWITAFDTNRAKSYHYVALRGGNRWYITGDATNYSTNDLITLIARQITSR